MATGFKYKFGKSLGPVLILTYVLSAGLGISGSAYGLDVLLDFKAWYYWLGAVAAGLLILWFVPRPLDVVWLSPLAIYGAVHGWGLTWTMAGIIIGVPLTLVLLMSMGRK